MGAGEGTHLHKRGFGSAEDGEAPVERRRASLTTRGIHPRFCTRGMKGAVAVGTPTERSGARNNPVAWRARCPDKEAEDLEGRRVETCSFSENGCKHLGKVLNANTLRETWFVPVNVSEDDATFEIVKCSYLALCRFQVVGVSAVAVNESVGIGNGVAYFDGWGYRGSV